MSMLTVDQQRACLNYPLFADDFGEQGDRVLADLMVFARKPRACHNCAEQIKPGDHVRRHVGLYSGTVATYSFCNLCCHAMVLNWTDNGKAICERHSLRYPSGTRQGAPA